MLKCANGDKARSADLGSKLRLKQKSFSLSTWSHVAITPHRITLIAGTTSKRIQQHLFSSTSIRNHSHSTIKCKTSSNTSFLRKCHVLHKLGSNLSILHKNKNKYINLRPTHLASSLAYISPYTVHFKTFNYPSPTTTHLQPSMAVCACPLLANLPLHDFHSTLRTTS